MKIFKNALLFGFFFLSTLTVFSQGNTNSSINGQVTDNQSFGIPMSNIIAVHVPSGTKYVASTDFDGFFRISNMRVGGPYTVTFSYVGYKQQEVKNIVLQLGESQSMKIVLEQEANELKEVIVIATKDNVFNSKKTGAQTIIDSKKINSLPSLSRNIADFARLTPQAQLRGDDVISISGQNNRYNAIYIDGAVNNDVFGLAGNGTNGGQTGVSPISLDAIEQFQVQVAPFDVKISGFAGGAISAITKSGTNNFEGSAYYLNRNEGYAGKTPPSLVATGGEREKLAEFNATTIGVRAAGAIKKDKLFYFINYERQDNETPQPFDINNYTGNVKNLTPSASVPDGIEFLRNNLITRFGYNPGAYTNNFATLKSDKFIAKIDWNINDNHKLALRHSLVKANDVSPSRSSANAINFMGGAIDFETTTNSSSLELNSRFGNKFANNLVVGYTSVVDDRNPFGSPFPWVEIQDGSSNRIFFGSEPFSTANLLEQKTLTVTDNFEINSGKHTITIGTHNEFSSAKNVFVGRNFGEYRFSTLNDFINNLKPNRFRLGYSLVGGDGDASQGAAEFDVMQFGGYIQDEFRVANNFKLTFGIRADVPVWDSYINNADFNNRTIPLLEAAGKDLQGARVGEQISTKVHLSPRLGFNYDVNGNKKTQIRGGLGIFTSRLPLVWPGGAYNNNGVTQGAVVINGATNALMPLFDPNTSVASQIVNQNNANLGPLPGNPGAPGQFAGNIDLFAKDFKLPQVFKASLAVDQKLPFGILFSGDITYNDNITAIKYENLNIQNPTTRLTGADTRLRSNGNTRVDNTYQGIYLASNTSEGKAWNASYTLSKTFTTDKLDVFVQGTHAYGESTVLFDATSSQNSSQWNNIETVNGSNNIGGVSRSDFDQGNRILGITSLTYKWNNNLKTKIGFYYEGTEGTPISYVYNDASGGGNNNLLRDTFSESALMFVPASQSQINLVSTTGGLTAQQQWDELNAFIEGNDYLRSRRGQYAERNGDRLKWSHVIDLKFAQEVSVNVGKRKHSFEITADIFNFTNMLNKNWGKRYFASFDQVQLVDHVGFLADGTTPTFRYNPDSAKQLNQVDDAGVNSSRWQAQLGVRYTFN
jgi:hypothetical protein